MCKSLIEADSHGDNPLRSLVTLMEWDLSVALSMLDISNLKMYVQLMTPISEKSSSLGADKRSTLQLYYPSVKAIVKHLRKIKEKHPANIKFRNFVVDLEKEFVQYFGFCTNPEDSRFEPMYMAATYLDPILSQLLTSPEKLIAVNCVKELIRINLKRKNIYPIGIIDPVVNQVENEPKTKRAKIAGFEDLESDGEEEQSQPGSTMFDRDFEKYNRECQVLRDKRNIEAAAEGNNNVGTAVNDSITYWFDSETKFESPVAEVSEDLLVIPAASTPCERLFSVAGALCKGKMARIKPTQLEQRALLKANKPIFN